MDLTDPLTVMALTVDGEAEGEGPDGWAAVAWVIKNRAAKPGWWGHDIISVCQAGHGSQFNCWMPGTADYNRIMQITPDDEVFQQIVQVCGGVIDGTIPDPTDGAESYFVTNMHHPPSWANGKPASAVIGHQSFYNNIG